MWRPSEDTRILDVGARNDRLARALRAERVTRYLALVPPGVGPLPQQADPQLTGRFQPLIDPGVVRRASADLLILRGEMRRVFWAWGELTHYSWVALEAPNGRLPAEFRVAVRLAVSRGRATREGRWRAPDGSEYVVLHIGIQEDEQARVYFSPAWGVTGLARRLDEEGIDYAVLRWFEDLPRIEPGEDLDILVSDDDVARFRALVESEPATQPIDLYSVSGLAGTDFRGAAYYVPALARLILERAQVHVSGMRVPSPIDHFRSLAYHALYHKGISAGVRSDLIDVEQDPEHDYTAVLARLAEEVGCESAITLEALDGHLASVGWRPPADALRRLSVHNSWLERLLDAAPGTPRDTTTGAQPAAFLIRERALETLAQDELLAVFERWGFEPLLVRRLTAHERDLATQTLRGGNWERGPYPVSGGGPALLLFAIHYAPGRVPPGLRVQYPHLTNADVLLAKQEMREWIERRVGADAAFNAVHSADEAAEAWHYLEVVCPEQIADVSAEFERRAADQEPGTDVVRTLSRGRRARVDVVSVDGGQSVRKTFTPSGSRHLARELAAMDALAGRVAAVPAVLERGENWFTMPLFHDRRADHARPLPLATLREMVRVLRELRSAGFVLVDAKPDNFIVTDSGLRVVDLEFAYPSQADDLPLHLGPEFTDPSPARFADIPAGDSGYAVRWRPSAALSAHALVDGTLLAQRIERARGALVRATVAPGSPARALARRARGGLRRLTGGLRRAVESRAWRPAEHARGRKAADAQ